MITRRNDGKTLSFENDKTGFCFEPSTGKLINIYSKTTRWDLIKRQRLAKSFSLLIPLKERRNNMVEGGTPTKVTITDNSVEFIYDTVTSRFGGKHEIKVVTSFKIDEETGTFDCYIDNKSDLTVENVCYPIIDDFTKPEDEDSFHECNISYSNMEKWPIYPEFKNTVGYWGSDSPTQLALHSPHNMFHMLKGEKHGIYIGLGENTNDIAAWKIQLFPGYENSMTSSVAKEAEICGIDKHICVTCAWTPYVMPKTEKNFTPIVMTTFDGTWHDGVDIYKKFLNKWNFKAALPPVWTNEPHSWLQIHINSPEDELRYKYTELVCIGKECAKHGIKAIQLVGWNNGGQDRGNPSHNTDDRLGSFDELKQAIKEIQKMGVKVVLFAKFTWSDRSSEQFKSKFINYAVKDPYDDYYLHPGYQYQTISQHLDINTRRLVPMCLLSEKYREICNTEFKKMVDLGADGILYDECQHHGNGKLCFSGEHGHRYGESNYKGDNKLIEGFRKITSDNPDFLYSGEACYDNEFLQYQMAYIRSNVEKFFPVKRYTFPDVLYMTAVIGFNDRNMINQCLMYKFIVSYEPYNFKGRPEDYPLTLEYGKKMDALRTELKEYFWNGDFLDTTIGSVKEDDGEKYENYSVFRAKSGKIGVVISNYTEKPKKLKTEFDSILSKYKHIDDDKFSSYAVEIEIKPQSAIVIV